MVNQVIGIETKIYDFDGQNGHVHSEGVTIYSAYPLNTRTGAVGMGCDKTYVSKEKLNGIVPQVGDKIEYNYNRFGKVQSVTLIEKAK